jgi:hypothetical protein
VRLQQLAASEHGAVGREHQQGEYSFHATPASERS